MARMPKYEKLRNRMIRNALRASAVPEKKNKFFALVNSPAFLWLASVLLISLGGWYASAHTSCARSADAQISPYQEAADDYYHLAIEGLRLVLKTKSTLGITQGVPMVLSQDEKFKGQRIKTADSKLRQATRDLDLRNLHETDYANSVAIKNAGIKVDGLGAELGILFLLGRDQPIPHPETLDVDRMRRAAFWLGAVMIEITDRLERATFQRACGPTDVFRRDVMVEPLALARIEIESYSEKDYEKALKREGWTLDQSEAQR
jgi:hypothetical protein